MSMSRPISSPHFSGGRVLRRSRLIVCCALILVIGTELGLRAILEEEEANGNYWGRGAFVGDASVGYRHAPGFSGRAKRTGVFDVSVSISSEGLRQHNVHDQLAFDRRLLILGDSYAFGLGVEENEAFPHLLQKGLNPKGIGVINGSQTGYSAYQSTALGAQLAARFSPHAILLCLFLGNDVRETFNAQHERIIVRYGYRIPKRNMMRGEVWDYLRTHSYAWMRLELQFQSKKLRTQHRKFSRLSRTDPEAAVRPTTVALQRFLRQCRRAGIELLVLSVPERKRRNMFNEVVLTSLSRHGVPILDLNDVEFGDDNYFLGDDHWNATGHRIAAGYISEFLNAEM